jgi:hypothetical protein
MSSRRDSLHRTRWIPPHGEVSFEAISEEDADEVIDGLRPVLADHEVGFSVLHQMGFAGVLDGGLVPRGLREAERYYLVLDYGDLFFAAHSGVYRRVEVGWRAIRDFFTEASDSDLGGRPVKPPVNPEWTLELVGNDPGDKRLADIDFQIRRFLQNLVIRQLKGRSPRVSTVRGRLEEGAWERGQRLYREQIERIAGELDLDERQSAVADGRSKEPDRPGALGRCPICRRTVSSGARVCGGCGTELCPTCHTTIASNRSRCGACGWSST